MLTREEVERRLEDMKNADARNAVLCGETQDCGTCEHCDKSAGEVPCAGCYLGSGMGFEWVSARKVVIHEREREALQTALSLYAERDAKDAEIERLRVLLDGCFEWLMAAFQSDAHSIVRDACPEGFRLVDVAAALEGRE